MKKMCERECGERIYKCTERREEENIKRNALSDAAEIDKTRINTTFR